MKIFLDDDPERDDWVDDTWTIVRSPIEVILLIQANEPIEEISFDHDLSYFSDRGQEYTGYTVLTILEEMVSQGVYTAPVKLTIHSANPVGRKNMQAAIDSIERMRNA